MIDFFEHKRMHNRKQYGVEVIFAHENNPHRGIIKNLSLGGAFISTANINLFSKGDKITINIPFTSGKKSVKRIGKIKWINQEGFAIEFA